MTPLEALRKLILDDFTPINDLVYRKGLNIQVAEPMYLEVSPQDCYNIIEKDLEVSEILKNQITITEDKKDNGFGNYTMIYNLNITTKGLNWEQFDKIRKWLENVNK